MYYEKPNPFYMAYPNPGLYEKESEYDRELKRMYSYFPRTAMMIQEEVSRECDMLEYEGSMMFDEYPDKFMMEHLANKIAKRIDESQIQAMDRNQNGLDDLIRVLLFHEMHQRRCRRRRCRRYF